MKTNKTMRTGSTEPQEKKKKKGVR
jgi:hypothetical protein